MKPSADVWSLGCIYSEAARWVVKGRRGLESYRRERFAETREIPNFRDGDCFHNGHQRLKAVDASHKVTSQSPRTDDKVTQRVLDRMVEEMLHTDEDARPTAVQLWAKVSDILTAARADLNALKVKSLGKESVYYFDPDRPRTPVQIPSGIPPFLSLVPVESQGYRINQNHVQGPPTRANNAGSILANEDQSQSPESWTDDETQMDQVQSLGSHVRGLSQNVKQLPTSPTQPRHSHSDSNNGMTTKGKRATSGAWDVDIAAEHESSQHHQVRNPPRGRGSHVSFSEHTVAVGNLLVQSHNSPDSESFRGLPSHEASVMSKYEPHRQASGTVLQTPPASAPHSGDQNPTTPKSLTGSHAPYTHRPHSSIGTFDGQQGNPALVEYHPQQGAQNLHPNSPPPTAPSHQKQPCYWSVEEVLEWIALKKKNMSPSRPPVERRLLERLKERDHVSMNPKNVRTNLTILARCFWLMILQACGHIGES